MENPVHFYYNFLQNNVDVLVYEAKNGRIFSVCWMFYTEFTSRYMKYKTKLKIEII